MVHEELDVGKRQVDRGGVRVIERRVGKQVEESTETIDDTVRRNDVDVERMEGQGARRGARERAVASDESTDTRDAARTECDMFTEPAERNESPTRRNR